MTVAGYGGATVARLCRRLSSNVLANADIVFVHIGENDYQQQQPLVTDHQCSSQLKYGDGLEPCVQCSLGHSQRTCAIRRPPVGLVHSRKQDSATAACRTSTRQDIAVAAKERPIQQPELFLRSRWRTHQPAPNADQTYWTTVRYAVLKGLRHQR